MKATADSWARMVDSWRGKLNSWQVEADSVHTTRLAQARTCCTILAQHSDISFQHPPEAYLVVGAYRVERLLRNMTIEPLTDEQQERARYEQ